MIMITNKNAKIAIIGAGSAGLSFAEALSEAGYHEITIFEKRNRVGGQALSIKYKTADNKEGVYELGSLQPLNGDHIFRLIKKYDLHIGKPPFDVKPMVVKLYSLQDRKLLIDFTKSPIGYSLKYSHLVFYDAIKLFYSLFKLRKLNAPGFSMLSSEEYKELAIPYEQWIDEQKFILIGDELKRTAGMILNAANPENKDEIPAIVLVKFLLGLTQFPLRYINGSVKQMKEGYQELDNRIANQHKVLLNTNITKITRNDNKVYIDYDGKTEQFDLLIVACAEKDFKNILDLTEIEKNIFSKARYNPCLRAACIATGLPHDALYSFFEPYANISYPFRLQTFVPEIQIDKDKWIYGCIFSHVEKEGFDEAKKIIEEKLHQHFNAKVEKWINLKYYDEYSPYFGCEDVKNGIYTEVDNLQGKNNTYFIGELLSGGTHPRVIDYSYDLVGRYFK